MGALGREETKAFRVLWTDLRPFDIFEIRNYTKQNILSNHIFKCVEYLQVRCAIVGIRLLHIAEDETFRKNRMQLIVFVVM